MNEKPTKAERTFLLPFDRLIEEFEKTSNQSDPLKFHQIKNLMELCLENELSNSNVKESLNHAFGVFERLMEILPEIAPRIVEGVSGLVFATVHNKIAIACETAEIERSRSIPKRKTMAKERALIIAKDQWIADTTHKIRIGDMAERVYRALASEGFTDSLPDTAERVKEWIKPVAPDYARKGGKPRKTT